MPDLRTIGQISMQFYTAMYLVGSVSPIKWTYFTSTFDSKNCDTVQFVPYCL